jgi:hypothetical protein
VKGTLSLAALLVLVPALAIAQGLNLPGGISSDNPAAGGGPQARALTPTETFEARLKLDEKTQVPQVEEILAAATRDAAPLAQQLLSIRQQMMNMELQKQTDQVQKAAADYADVAGKIASIEAAAFAKVYALLKPNQQKNANDAFEVLPVIVAPAAGGRSGGGGFRGRPGGGGR